LNILERELRGIYDAARKVAVSNLDNIVKELAPSAKMSGNIWSIGDVHGSKGASMWIYRTGSKAGGWCDAGNTPSRSTGDMLHFVMLNRGFANVRQAAEFILDNWR
jgi:hypothetical protein